MMLQKLNLKWIIATCLVATFSCGKAPSLLPINELDEKSENDTSAIDENVPAGIHWRQEIGTFKFNPDRALNWDYSEEGVILVPSDDVDKSFESADGDLTELKKGDVILVWGQYIVFVKEVVTTDEGIEISVRPFVLTEAIYGDFDLSFAEENQGIGNLGGGNSTTTLRSDIFGKDKGGITVKVDGHLKFSFDTDSKFEGFIPQTPFQGAPRVDHLGATVTFRVDFLLAPEVSLMGVLSDKLSPDLTKDTLVKKINEKIPSIKLGTTGLAIKPDFYIPRSIEMGIAAGGKVGVKLKAEAKLPLGFEYYGEGYEDRTSTEFNFFPNATKPATFKGSNTWTGSTSVKAFIKADIGLGFDFKIVPVTTNSVGIKGLGFENKINAEVSVDPLNPKQECLVNQLYANVTAKAAGKFFIEGWSEPWEWTFLPGASVSKQLLRHDIIPKETSSLFCVGSPDPDQAKVTLTWNEGTDLDIYLETPDGTVNQENPTNEYARLIKDTCYTESTCIDGEKHVEVINILAGGEYKYWAKNASGKRSANYKFEVIYPNGEKTTQSGQISEIEGSLTEIFKIKLR